MDKLPNHIAVVMDGNGRWAKLRKLSRNAGHKAGVEATRTIIQATAKRKIKALTLFAFSSENWNRPKKEVNLLMDLFLISLKREISKLHKNNIRIRFIGDREVFNKKLYEQINQAENLTQANSGLALNIAVNYGGRWDIVNACQQIATKISSQELSVADIDEQCLSGYLTLADIPEPDLFIRTSGECRISNFLLWQCAYSELYFTDTLWPDFDDQALQLALDNFAARQRRFGKTGEQLETE
ncbi:Undecaprenyl diphosphate synthase [hydrothermal vent metagenome]|uniref:Undecaprenyl diphosphate synthase n=1 Tax=hydrothermal vent metagenome TaxID=652676 RepID=A0A3B0YJP0_9ZZZZ